MVRKQQLRGRWACRSNQISVVIEQVGGGFGGKQHRAAIAGAQAAVAARKVREACG